MANNTTLIGLVQADIDALDGTQTLGHLIDLKIAAVKLGMSTTAVDAIDTRLDALDMSAADTATLMENAVANEVSKPVTNADLTTVETNVLAGVPSSPIKSIQRGSSSAANISVTIAAVDLSKTILNVQTTSGYRNSGGSGGGVAGAYMLDSTTLRTFQGLIEGNSSISYATVNWEVIEYV